MASRIAETEEQRRARYATREVTDKLGIKDGYRVRAIGKGDPKLLARVRFKTGHNLARSEVVANVVLYWPRSAAEVTATLADLKGWMAPDGGIWVISAKKGGEPYLPDRILIPLGLRAGLVDNKICSISDTHTAMRFVIRRSER